MRAPGIYGLSTEGEQVQAQPQFARVADNVAYDSAGRLGNRKGFSSTSSKYATTLGANPITPAAATAADDDGIAVAARPVTTFTLVGGSLPPTAPRYVSATNAAKTFATSTVDTSANTVDFGSAHALATTNSVTYHNGGGTALAGLAHESTYYVIKVDNDTISLASSYDNAVDGTAISLTGTGNNSQYFTDGDKTVTLTGTDVSDAAITETLTLPTTAGVVNGTALFKTVTKAEISGYPVANVKVGVQASTIVTIAHTTHGKAVGDTVYLSKSTAVSGVDAAILNATSGHVLTNIPDANSYKIVVLDSSTGTTAGGGSVVATSAVDTSAETVTITSHGLVTGDLAVYHNGGGTTLAGLTSGDSYYVIRVNDNAIKLATNQVNAYAGTGINLTGTGNNAQYFTYIVAKFVGLLGNPDIEQVFQYNASGGNKLIASATVSSARKLFKLDSPYSDFEDITGSISPSGNDWQFVNFDDKVIGARTSNSMIVYTGSGTFTAISASSGTVPDGNIVHSAFGRLWAQKADTGTGQNVIAYCDLLDETDWSSGGGEIDLMSNKGSVHTGFDTLTAISSFDGYLVAFLRDSIVIFDSPEDPSSLVIEQIIQGIGCIARDSVQQVGNDVYFLSDAGVRSLKQVVFTADRVEMKELSKIVRKDLVESMNTPSGNLAKIRSTYDPVEGQYWIKAPNGDIWVFNNFSLIESEEPRVTKYISTDWYSFVYFEGDTFISYKGCIGKYSGYSDIDVTTSPPSTKNYTCRWASNYADFDTSKLKILKNVGLTVFGASGQQITIDWDFDIGQVGGSSQLTIPGAGSLAEWGEAEWNVGEWAGSISLDKLRAAASRMGRVLSVGVSFTSSGNAVSVEQLSLFAKLGREDR